MTRHDLPPARFQLLARGLGETAEADAVCAWTVAPEQGWLQGPLDLSFFSGRQLVLTLQENQVALLEQAGDLKTVLLDGVHHLPATGVNTQEPGCNRLFFVHTDVPASWRWQEGAVLWVGQRTVRQAVPIIGTCSVAVTGPVAFYRAFLRGVQTCESGFVQNVLDTLVRSRLEARLEALDGDSVALQTVLTHFAADDLTAELDEYGLACAHLAIYTRQAPVTDTVASYAGHSPAPRDNDH